MNMDRTQPIEILLIESKAGYAEAARQAFSSARLQNRLHIIDSGEEALDFLYKRGKHRGAPRPDVIILDPSVSGRNGWSVFAEIKADPDLNQIPLVIQTVSKSEAELLKTYNLNDLFIIKPIDCDAFINIVRSIEGFGMAVVRCPKSTTRFKYA